MKVQKGCLGSSNVMPNFLNALKRNLSTIEWGSLIGWNIVELCDHLENG